MNRICDCLHEDRRHKDISLFNWGSGECTLCRCKFFENQEMREDMIREERYRKSLIIYPKIPKAQLMVSSGKYLEKDKK